MGKYLSDHLLPDFIPCVFVLVGSKAVTVEEHYEDDAIFMIVRMVNGHRKDYYQRNHY